MAARGRGIGLALCVAMILSCASAWANEDQEAENYLLSGDQFYENFDNKSALDVYRKAYEINPDSFKTLLKLTRSLIDVGEDLNSNESEAYYEEAVKYSELLKENFPESPYTYACLASSYGYLAVFRGGKEKIRLSNNVTENAYKAIALDPDYEVPYIVLGTYYREVANLSPFLRAFAKIFLGDVPNGSHDDSIECLKKALRIRPDSVYTVTELAKTYASMRKYDSAMTSLRNVLKMSVVDHLDPRLQQEADEKILVLKRKLSRRLVRNNNKFRRYSGAN